MRSERQEVRDKGQRTKVRGKDIKKVKIVFE
jgi:hypothetical protein